MIPATIATVTRAELVAQLQQLQMPVMVKMGMLTALSSLVSDEQFYHWRGVIARAVAALAETESGRGVLQELGITLE